VEAPAAVLAALVLLELVLLPGECTAEPQSFACMLDNQSARLPILQALQVTGHTLDN
jgi:hypothetical protein